MKKVILMSVVASMTFASQLTTKATINLEQTSNQLHMVLNSEESIYGVQFDVRYDAAKISLTEENINHMFSTSDSRANMSIYSKIKEPGMARVIMFDLGGNALLSAGDAEKIISIAYNVVDNYSGSFSIEIENIVAAGENGVQVSAPESYSYHANASDASNSLNDTPNETGIKGNYPNPFNPTTEIKFDLSADNAGLVNVSVFDIQGRKVATLHNDITSAGYHTYLFDASNFASGKYFVRISTPNYTETHNMTLLK